MTGPPQRPEVVLLSAGTGQPSTTRLVADRIGAKLTDVLGQDGPRPSLSAIELAPLATDIAAALVGGMSSPALQAAIAATARADVLVTSTPVYKAGVSGLFKSYVDVLDNDLLVGEAVVLAASAGSARHAIVVDDHMRPLFAFLRAVPVPTSLFAAPEDWADPALNRRIERAAVEAGALFRAGREITATSWDHYQHEFDSTARHPERPDTDVDFDTPLMRLAAGGDHRPASGGAAGDARRAA